MNLHILISIIRKEFIQIRRDPRTLGLVMFLPIFMLIIYGYGITFDVRNVSLALYDADRTPESREIIKDFINSGYFSLAYVAGSEKGIDHALNRNIATIGLIIHPRLMEGIKSSQERKIQLILDGTDSNTATIALGYAQAIIRRRSAEIISERLDRAGLRVPFDTPLLEDRLRIWFNEELKSSLFIVPGIIAIITMIMGSVLTSLTVVLEKERGTIKQISISPVRPSQFLIGKLVPYILISFADMILIIILGYILFHVPIKGSLILLMIAAFIYLISILMIGIFVSTVTDTPEGAMMLAVIISLLPSILLSGFVFPIENMPKWIQVVTYIVPARYFLDIIRGIFLKGIGFQLLWKSFLWLSCISLGLFMISTLRFRREVS